MAPVFLASSFLWERGPVPGRLPSFLRSLQFIMTTGPGVTEKQKVDQLPQSSKGSKAGGGGCPYAVTCSEIVSDRKEIKALASWSQAFVSRRATEGRMVCPAGMLWPKGHPCESPFCSTSASWKKAAPP